MPDSLSGAQSLLDEAQSLFNEHLSFLERLDREKLSEDEVKFEVRMNEQVLDRLFETLPRAHAALAHAGHDAPRFVRTWAQLEQHRKASVVIDPSASARAIGFATGIGAKQIIKQTDIEPSLRGAIVDLKRALPRSYHHSPHMMTARKKRDRPRLSAAQWATASAALFIFSFTAPEFIDVSWLGFAAFVAAVVVGRTAFRSYVTAKTARERIVWTADDSPHAAAHGSGNEHRRRAPEYAR